MGTSAICPYPYLRCGCLCALLMPDIVTHIHDADRRPVDSAKQVISRMPINKPTDAVTLSWLSAAELNQAQRANRRAVPSSRQDSNYITLRTYEYNIPATKAANPTGCYLGTDSAPTCRLRRLVKRAISSASGAGSNAV